MDAIALLEADHQKVKRLLTELESGGTREEGEMFCQARQVFDARELDELGQMMEARKHSAARELGIPVCSSR